MKTVKKSTYVKTGGETSSSNFICSTVRCASNNVSANIETRFKEVKDKLWDGLDEDQRISIVHDLACEVQIRFCSGFSDLPRKYAIKFKNLKKCFDYVNKTVEEEGSDYLALIEFMNRGDVYNTRNREMREEDCNF